MNNFIKYTKFHFIPLLLSLLVAISMGSCSDDDDEELVQAGYGHVQFKLYKGEAQTRADDRSMADKLEKLNDAKKIKVILQHKGATIEQTLVLNAYNEDNAEFGLRSDKMKLLAGDYKMVGFFLYDKLDEQLYASGAGLGSSFTVVAGGMTSADLTVETVARGMVKFKVVKDITETRAADTYTFDNIKCVTVTVKNLFTQELTTIEKMQVKFTEDYTNGHWSAYGKCDSIVWLKAGTYQVTSYTTYNDKKGKNGSSLETAVVPASETFRVEDNRLTEGAEIPVRLNETAEYIKDYLALKEIWEAMDGPHWSYIGEEQIPGSNWDFENRDIDMWGYQPGVQLMDNGRVAYISIAGMGARGCLPDAIGQLTELRVLYLGTHSELLGGKEFAASGNRYQADSEKRKAQRMDYYNRRLKHDVRSALSAEMQEAINAATDDKVKHIEARIETKDVQAGQLSNGLTGISRALKRCTKLEQIYVANSPLKGGDLFFTDIKPDSPFYEEEKNGELKWSNLTSLIDVEIYNCPQMDALPMEMLSNLPELQSLNIACNSGIPGDVLTDNWAALATPRAEDADETDMWEYEYSSLNADKIQLMYMGFNNMETTPYHYALKNMKKLGLLDLSHNKLTEIHPFGKGVNLVQFFLDNNRLSKLPKADDGYFFGYADLETFSCANNQFTELPDIFDAKSSYVSGSINFSNNQISGFENGENHRGYNAGDIDLSYNKLETFPGLLIKKGSPIKALLLAGNGMKNFPEGSLEGPYSYFLTTLDLSYNKLSELPIDFATNCCPYLYGIDVSYNHFSKFPYAPLNSAYLNIFMIRYQRDSQGNRILREWPTGLYRCPSLVRFFIGGNDLRKIDDTISPNIRIFEIKDNPNISIDMSKVCPYIKAGMYQLIYDKTQDIRGCDALNIN